MSKKIQVMFDEEARRGLEAIQRESGATSIAEVVRSALGLYEWALEQVAHGYTVGAFREGAPVKEIVIGRRLGRRREQSPSAATGTKEQSAPVAIENPATVL